MMTILWWIGVLLTLFVFGPVAGYLLHTTYRAARSIQLYSREALAAAGGIARNTAQIPALDVTQQTAGQMLDTAVEIDLKLATIAKVLAERAGR